MNESTTHDSTLIDSADQVEELVLVSEDENEEAEDRMRYFEFFGR